jgi:hypothetical protein
VASADNIRLLLNIAASNKLLISLTDISNAFQNSLIFNASERAYLSLLPLYLTWFTQVYSTVARLCFSRSWSYSVLNLSKALLSIYFKDIASYSIKKQLYPFPTEASFKNLLYEAPSLTGIDLINATKHFRSSFGHIVEGLMHISRVSCPDLFYCVMC